MKSNVQAYQILICVDPNENPVELEEVIREAVGKDRGVLEVQYLECVGEYEDNKVGAADLYTAEEGEIHYKDWSSKHLPQELVIFKLEQGELYLDITLQALQEGKEREYTGRRYVGTALNSTAEEVNVWVGREMQECIVKRYEKERR